MSVIANLFSAAMYAFVLQNLIFTGGYGASEAVRMAAKPKQLLLVAQYVTRTSHLQMRALQAV